MKKKFLLVLIIVFVVLTALAIYFIFKTKKEEISSTPFKLEDRLKQIFEEKVYFPTLLNDEESILFLGEDKNSFKKIVLGKDEVIETYPLSLPEEFEIADVIWSTEKDKVILEIVNDNYRIKIYTYDFNKKELYPLHNNISTAVFAEGKIIYCFQRKYKASLNQSNINGKDWSKILELNKCDKIVGYNVEAEKVLYFEILTDVRSNLNIVDLKRRQIKVQIKDNFLKGKLSPDHEKMLALIDEEGKERYLIMDFDGSEKKELDIQTEIEKISWSQDGQILVVALKEEGTESESLYKINSSTAEKEKIKFEFKKGTEIKNLIISKDKRVLYFTSDDQLYRLDI